MAVGTPDPIPATFQILGLSEADGPDESDRAVLRALKERLRQTSEAADGTAWLAWYREALDATRTLSTRWSARRSKQPDAPMPTNQIELALTRFREAPAPFVQRWVSRLQDQSHQVRDQLTREASTVPVHEYEAPAQTIYEIAAETRAAFGRRVSVVLNAWSAQVAAGLTPSWHEWLLAAMAEDRLPRASSAPPPWPSVHLSTSAEFVPHLEPGAARRTTAFAAFMRAMSTGRGCASVGVAAVPSLLGILVGGIAESGIVSIIGAGAGAILTACVAIPFGILYGRSMLRDEHEQTRRDQEQRLRSSLHGWITTAVETHRGRMSNSITASAQEARARHIAWIESSWTSAKRTAPPPSGDSDRETLGPLLSTLNMARSAIAARAAQLELQVGK